jgi:hypothetical protein
MPGILDPFTPGQDSTPYAGVEPGMFDKIRGEWGAFLSDPKGRAAMMSAGLALMQPPSFGDNALSQFGRAIGSAGSSAQLAEQQDLKRSELESKDAMREAQAQARLMTADAAQQRAEAAGARLGTAGAQLELRKQALENAQSRSQLSSRLRLSGMYQNEVARINKENANAKLLGQPEKPILPFRDWVTANPALRSLGLLDEGAGGAAPEDVVDTPPTADTTSGRNPQDAAALAWANANPTDPRAIAIKKRLGVP